MKTKTIAAIYVRVSTREQAEEGYSLSAQEKLLYGYCKDRGYQIYKIYADEGISAKDIKNRPGMLQMLADAKERKFNVILIWKLSRLSRSMYDLVNMYKIFDKENVSLISYSENFDGTTPAGRLMRDVLAATAEFEREVIAENVKMGLLERARQGNRTCHNILGYDKCGKDSFVVNKREAEYVMFNGETFLKNDISLTETSEICKAHGYRGKNGATPTSMSTYVILTHVEYAGFNIHKGKLYKGKYEPIMPVSMHNDIQKALIRRGKRFGQPRKKPLYFLPE